MTEPQGDPADRRIVQLSEFERPEGGSFIPMLVGVLEVARAHGWEPEAVFFDSVAGHGWLANFERAGIRVRLAPASLRGSRRGLRAWLEAELPAETPTVLHTHFTRWDLPALALARRRARTAVIWHVHSTLPRRPAVVARSAFKFGVLGGGVAAILCPAPNIVDAVRARFGRRDRVELVPSAIDLEMFRPPTEAQRAAARGELGLKPDERALLHFGWHTRLKGTDLFLRAVRRIVDDGERDVVAVERGGGEEAAALAASFGVADRLRLVEPVERAQTLHYGADVLVQSSRDEGMAYAVLEALACGTPVVATRIPGHALIGDEVQACRLVAVDAKAIADGIEAMLGRDPETAAAEAREARDWLAANLSVSAIGEQLAAIYARALA